MCLKVYSGLLKQSLGFGLSVSLTEPAKPSLSPCISNRNNRFPERALIALTICIKSLYFYLTVTKYRPVFSRYERYENLRCPGRGWITEVANLRKCIFTWSMGRLVSMEVLQDTWEREFLLIMGIALNPLALEWRVTHVENILSLKLQYFLSFKYI